MQKERLKVTKKHKTLEHLSPTGSICITQTQQSYSQFID